MWERQYERGRWNGHKLNILATGINGGKRLHVSEIPYADLPSIKVMGSKARKINLDVAFVGPASLSDANAFIENLEATPKGELEHPWLGELPLVFEDFSQNITTKRGLVTLSLSFVRAGITPTIDAPSIVRTRQQALDVENISKQTFAQDVKKMDVAAVNQTQTDYRKALETLVDITNRLNIDSSQRSGINSNINDAFTKVSSLTNDAESLSDAFTAATDAVAEGVHSEPESPNEAIDNARSAQSLMLNQVNDQAPSEHLNTQVVMGAVKMSKDLTLLESSDTYDVSTAKHATNIATKKRDLQTLSDATTERIKAATSVSTKDSLEQYDALSALRQNIDNQHAKVIAGTEPQRVINAPKFRPLLTLAHDEYTKENILRAINTTMHPLFVRGDIAVRDA